MKTIIDNVSINYEDHGQSGGLPLIFIHGFPFNLEMWKFQKDNLPGGIRAIFYDIRGHGASETGDGIFTVEFFVDDLISLLDRLSIKKAVLCGLSMGGYIALRAYEKHPDRVYGMVLCDTKSEPDTDEAKLKRASNIRAIKEKGVESFAEDFVKSVFCKNTLEKNPDIINHALQMIRRNSPAGLYGTLLALAARTDTTGVLPSIKCPVCIITGEHDRIAPPSIAEKMNSMIPGSVLHIIPGAGHMSNLENIAEFNKALFSFLNRFI